MRREGLTLLELIVIIAVLGIIATAITPAIVQRITDSRAEATRQEARALVEAMVGKPDQQPRSFGFAGDMGRLPQSFTELAQAGGLPTYTASTVRAVGMGWNGPYINVGESAADYLTDAFGRPYTGASTGQAISRGVDGVQGTADDIVYPPSPSVIVGRVAVTVKTIQGNKTIVDPAGYEVRLYYSNGGVEAMLADGTSPFVFDNVPMGLHAVQVVKTSNPQAGSVVAQETITSQGQGRTTAVELWF